MIRALYIHGYNGSGYTGKAMNNIAKYYIDDVKVFTEKFSKNPEIAIRQAKDIVDSCGINCIIAPSYGAFIALQIKNVCKVLINPCLYPSIELPKIDTKFSFVNECKIIENSMNLEQDKDKIYAIFSTNDELFSYKNEFKNCETCETFSINAKHKLTDFDIHNYLMPILTDNVIPKLNSNNNFNNFN